jgi:hypothetical protein
MRTKGRPGAVTATWAPSIVTSPFLSQRMQRGDFGGEALRSAFDRGKIDFEIAPPVAEREWDFTHSIRMVHQLMGGRMYPLTLEGLDRAMRELVR